MTCYFQERLKYSINVKIEQQEWEFVNFEKIVQRAVNTEVKASLRSSTIVRNSDIRYPRGKRFFNNIVLKVQT